MKFYFIIQSGDSLLHQAASSNNQPAGLFLIEHGALVNHINKAGESPLHGAAKNGLVELVDRLLKRFIFKILKIYFIYN